MKNLLLFIIFQAMFCSSVFAKQVDEETAKSVGQAFLVHSTKKAKTDINLTLAYRSSAATGVSMVTSPFPTYFYVFNDGTDGFVIVAGDDKVSPILGYSDEGAFDPGNIPSNVAKWLEGYKSQIRHSIENGLSPSSEIEEEWAGYANGASRTDEKSVTSVNPLVQTKWNQSPYENALCPYDNMFNDRTVTGCPATAMAQIMKYWNYPASGTGFHSYNHQTFGTLTANFGSTSYQWASMPNRLTGSNNAVATLMYHCGVAVEMNYGVAATGGSSSYVIVAAAPSVQQTCENAFVTYFGYNASSIQGLRRSNYLDNDWINLLKNELDQSRPIQYAGFGSGGHTWVCDGYDNNNFFHMNWGWGGSQDGYFRLNALTPGGGGIGGAGYSYNNSQQALIGIQPPSGGGTQTIDLQLYSNINMPSTQIRFIDAFSLSVDVANMGGAGFSGLIGAAVFDNNNNFVDFIGTVNVNIQSRYYNSLTFSNPGSRAFVPGAYYAALFYKTTTQDWTIIGNGNYNNLKQFQIYNSSTIETNSAINITTNRGKLIQGQSANINVDVTNTGANTFYGEYRVGLSNLDGTLAQSIQVLTENNGLQSNYHYLNGNNFTGVVTVTPGTYLLEVAYKSQGSSNWYYAGSTNFSNPIYVVVEAPSISPDQYENNNLSGQAYLLPLSMTGNTATKNTVGSNFHIGTDYDYYKVTLPPGYNYTLSARIHDSYNSGNGNSYSVDALFAYSTNNGATWSDFYDDVMTGNVNIPNGGTIYFHVAPYFSGGTGSYLLDMSINRTTAVGVEEFAEKAELIKVFPNPATDFVIIDLSEFSENVHSVNLFNLHGQQIGASYVTDEESIKLPLQDYANGVYLIQIQTEHELLSKKILIQK